MQDRYVDVGSVRTRYWEVGTGEPIILIHGLGGSVEGWTYTMPALGRRYRVIAPDLIGFGRSDKPKAYYGLELLSSFLKAFMDRMGVARAHLIGLSLGGAVVVKTATRWPERVGRMVLVNSAGFGRQGSMGLRLATVGWVGELLTHTTRTGAGAFLRNAVHDASLVTKAWMDCTYELARLPGAQAAYLTTLRSLADCRGLKASVLAELHRGMRALREPVMVVWGRQDKILPVSHTEIAAQLMPQARIHVFERCGHLPPLEHPAAFNALVSEFLAEDAAAAGADSQDAA